MGFSVPAISCMLTLPGDMSLFYLKMINGVAVIVHQPAAAPLHASNEPCELVSPPPRDRKLHSLLCFELNEPQTFTITGCRPARRGQLGYLGLVQRSLSYIQLNNMLL